MTITRRTFTADIDALFVSHAISGCTDPATDFGNSAISSTGPSSIRELVTMDQPGFIEVNLGHVSPDLTDIEVTIATVTVDPSRRQCLFPWEEDSASTTTGPGSNGHDPAGSRPTVTNAPTTGNTTVKRAVLPCAGEAFALRGDSSDYYPTAARLSALDYHCFIVGYRMQPHTQAEAGCDLARATRFVRARVANYNLPNAQRIALGGYSADGILRGRAILNWSGSASPTELDANYTPNALDAISTDAATATMIYSFYGRPPVAELDPNRLTGAVPTCCCYSTKDPFHDQFEAQAKVLAGSGVTLRAHVLDNWPYGFGVEGGWIEEYGAFLQQTFASA